MMKPTGHSDYRALTHHTDRVQMTDASLTTRQGYQALVRRVGSTCDRPNTHFFSARDNFLQILDQALQTISKQATISPRRIDKLCGTWSRKLRNAMDKQAISPAKVVEYIPHLFQFINTFPQWEAKHLIDTYRHLVDVDFFSQSENANPEIRAQVVQLNDQLLNTIIHKIHNEKPEKISLSSHLYLYCGIIKGIKFDSQNQTLINNALAFLVRKLESNITKFSVMDYRIIIENTYTFIINTGDTHKSLVQNLIEYCLHQMAMVDKHKKDNYEFVRFFNNIAEFIYKGFPVTENIENAIHCLYKKIHLNTNIKTAILGTNTIIDLAHKGKISLNRETEEKIYKTCEFIEKNHYHFKLLDSSMIASFINKLIQTKDKKCPERLIKLLELSLNHQISNIPNLSIRQLMKLLVIIKELMPADVHIHEFVIYFLDSILKIDNELLALPTLELYCQLVHLSRILKSLFTQEDGGIYKNTLLYNFINRLIEEISKHVRDATLSIRSNNFIALSDLASIGFLVDKNKRSLIVHLYSTLLHDAENFTLQQAIDFLHSCCIFGDLFDFEIEKHCALFKRIFPTIVQPKYKLKKKLTYMWSMIVFSAMNEEKINQHPSTQLNREIFEIFSSIDRKTLYEPYAHQILTIAENWFGKKSTFVKERQENLCCSHYQALVAHRLREHVEPTIQMIEEYSVNDLAPCDIALPDQKIIIEVQGVFHFLDDDRKCKNGSTLLKNNLYRKKGYQIIEVQVCEDGIRESDVDTCIKQIETALKLSKN